MENHPNMESFEKFIKQQSDEFRMYPSKKVWYSIYNNFHPGRKWPSISMCIVLLSALLMIGYLNTKHNTIVIDNNDFAQSNNTKTTGKTTTAIQLLTIPNQHNENIGTHLNGANTKELVNKLNSTSSLLAKKVKADKVDDNSNNLLAPSNKLATTKNIASTNKINSTTAKKIFYSNVNKEEVMAALATTPNNSVSNSNDNLNVQNSVLTDENNATLQQKIFNNHQINTIHPTSLAANISANGLFDIELTNAANISPINITTNSNDKQWIENYALYNRPAPRKWKGKLAWQAYFTPSVIYRQLYNNTTGKNISGNTLATTLNNSSINSVVNQTPSIGLEAGLGLQFPILKGVKLNAGLQLNYTRFNISAFGNAHPTATSLTMNNENYGQVYELSRSTPYSNIIGLNPETLHNQTYQLSLPIGADIKLAGIDNVEWYVGATIQPTFVLAANSYLISTDRRNYVKENSMLNHFNMNAGFETYISFKTAAGLTWQIGPQFRKQLFSTNSKLFSIEERLMGYGLKIGISKKL